MDIDFVSFARHHSNRCRLADLWPIGSFSLYLSLCESNQIVISLNHGVAVGSFQGTKSLPREANVNFQIAFRVTANLHNPLGKLNLYLSLTRTRPLVVDSNFH
jgi:hypothetical protein